MSEDLRTFLATVICLAILAVFRELMLDLVNVHSNKDDGEDK